MPFQKGKVANPKGGIPRSVLNIKWEIIDGYVSEATKKAFEVVNGTDPDFQAIDEPKDRVDAKLKAIGHILKLAPQRQANADGGNMPSPILAYVSGNNSNAKGHADDQANPSDPGRDVSQQDGISSSLLDTLGAK